MNHSLGLLDASQGIALITDGSANWKDRSGGWAWIALDAYEGLLKEAGACADATNNQMELMAPATGLETLFANCGACEVLIYADSEYVVLGAMNPGRARKKNVKWWQRLDEAIAKHTSVDFIHVKGHNGHIWNEMADEMAGTARRKGAVSEANHRAPAHTQRPR